MPTVSKITHTLFDNIKTELEYCDPITVAIKNRLSMKTILMIKGSADYNDYIAQKEAQHPKTTKPSMRETLIRIEEKMDKILDLSRENRLV